MRAAVSGREAGVRKRTWKERKGLHRARLASLEFRYTGIHETQPQAVPIDWGFSEVARPIVASSFQVRT